MGKAKKIYRAKQCAVCGKEFKPKTGNQKYCSPECAGIHFKDSKGQRCEYMREYRRTHEDYRKCERECGRRYYWAHRDKMLEYAKRYQREHREEINERIRKNNPNALEGVKRECAVCGKEFKPKTGNQKYCSPECNKEGKREYCKEYYRNHKVRREVSDGNPKECPFDGSCFDCPYPDCIVE